MEVVFQTCSLQFALCDCGDRRRVHGLGELRFFYLMVIGQLFVNARLEQRIVRATENERVDERVFGENLPQVFTYEILRAR